MESAFSLQTSTTNGDAADEQPALRSTPFTAAKAARMTRAASVANETETLHPVISRRQRNERFLQMARASEAEGDWP